MTTSLKITSPKNPRIKTLLDLGKHKHRTETGLFLVEGAREIGRALACAYSLTELYFCQDALSELAQDVVAKAKRQKSLQLFEVTSSVFERLAVREGSDGLLGVFKAKTLTLANLNLPAKPLIVAVQGIEKPGNLGALLRSADGAGADAVILLDKTIDIYNPNVIRSSIGTVFNTKVVAASSAELRDYCKSLGLATYAAALIDRSIEHYQADFKKPCVILLGEEAFGLTPDWLKGADACVKIPMRGVADSLNVATAGAILLYEALRQRLA